jgi:ATP-dependent Lon protease
MKPFESWQLPHPLLHAGPPFWRAITAPLIILPAQNTVLFPGVVRSITVGRPKCIAAAQQAMRDHRPIGVVMQRHAAVSDPTSMDMYRVGTVANIVRCVIAPDGAYHLVCQGEQRFHISDFLSAWPYFVARVLRVTDAVMRTPAIEARFFNLRSQAAEVAQLLPQAPSELLAAVQSVWSPAALADITIATMDVNPEVKQDILETIDVTARIDKVLRLLAHRIEVLRLSHEIGRQIKVALDQRQREVLLGDQRAPVQRQSGQGAHGKAAELSELKQAIAAAGMRKDVEEHARKELRRLQHTP